MIKNFFKVRMHRGMFMQEMNKAGTWNTGGNWGGERGQGRVVEAQAQGELSFNTENHAKGNKRQIWLKCKVHIRKWNMKCGQIRK